MNTKLLISAALATIIATPALAQTQTNRQLQVIGAPMSTEFVPAAGQDLDVRPVVGIFWDERCSSVEYTFNTNVGANPGTANEVDPATLAAIVQTGLDRWNANPSSYIEMNVTAQTDLGNRPRVGGDFINEVTFITPGGFGALASSPSTSLTADAVFMPGDDLDGDSDSDVFDPAVEGINVCSDVDGDGDIEFPAGNYKAGTILDNDVQFSSTVVWETTPSPTGGADVDAVSTHEFGHSHGLSHSFINQISPTDGSSATMFPFIDTSNPLAEFAVRTPHTDDLAASAYIYQEGVGTTPASAISAGDIPFSAAYALIKGKVETNALIAPPGAFVPLTPVAGAAVSARQRNGRIVQSMAYSGDTVVYTLPGDATGTFVFDDSVRDGEYSIPVPQNQTFGVEIEALDGSPAAAGNISIGAIIGDILGQTSFPEENYQRGDFQRELRFKERTPLNIGTFDRNRVDIINNVETIQREAGPIDFGGTGAIIGASSIRYAQIFDRAEVETRLDNGETLIGGGAEAFHIQENTAAFSFSRAQLALVRIDDNGELEIGVLLDTENNILAQRSDTTRFNWRQFDFIRDRIERAFDNRPDAELALILDIDNVQTGPNSGLPLGFVGLDSDVTEPSFLSLDGGAFQQINGTWAMELNYLPPELIIDVGF